MGLSSHKHCNHQFSPKACCIVQTYLPGWGQTAPRGSSVQAATQAKLYLWEQLSNLVRLEMEKRHCKSYRNTHLKIKKGNFTYVCGIGQKGENCYILSFGLRGPIPQYFKIKGTSCKGLKDFLLHTHRNQPCYVCKTYWYTDQICALVFPNFYMVLYGIQEEEKRNCLLMAVKTTWHATSILPFPILLSFLTLKKARLC